MLLVVWREDSQGNAGLNYKYIKHYSETSYSVKNSGKFPNTDAYSSRPSLVIQKTQANPNYISIYFVWQQNSTQIRYLKINQNGSTISASNYSVVSSGSGFPLNYHPSVTLAKYQSYYLPEVSWVGGSLSEIGGAPTEKRVVKRGYSQNGTWGFFYNVGNDVLHQSNNLVADYSAYVTAWSEMQAGGYANKFIKDREYNNIHSFGTNGAYIAIGNGNNLNDMRAVSFNTSSLPYEFMYTQTIGNLSKETSITIAAGRKGVVFKDTAEFSFAFGDIELNGSPVEFEEIVDSNYVNDLTHINQYLRTKPFTLSGGDALTYSVLYGLTDSLFSTQILSQDNFVHFKVELIDDNTDEVLGIYDDITYDLNNLDLYDNIAYSVNTDGMGTKTVRLRLVVEDNLGGGYGFSKIYAEGSALGKTRGYVELPYQGSLAVEQYALMQNYPNPFSKGSGGNPTTTIKYEIPETGFVTLKIYDVLGREVATLVNAKREAGRYEAEFNAKGLSSGIYIYRIQAGTFVESKKMILLK